MLTIYRGDTPTISVTVTEENVAFDLMDWVAKLTVKGDIKSTETLLEKEIDPIPNPETGIVVFDLTSAETDLPIGEHYYDIEISTKTEPIKRHTVACEKIKVLQDVNQ